MKVLLYFEGEKALGKSGIGRALEHQKKALAASGVNYTMDASCTDYDVVHINTYGLKSRAMVQKAKKAGKKIVYHAHSTEEDFRNSFIGSNQLSPLVKKYLISLYSQADHIVTPTDYSKELIKSYGITVPISAVSNGIDLEKYKKSEEKETAFRNHFNIKDGEKVIICVGLFFERKGIIDFIEVAKLFPEYRFIWFGHVPLMSIPSHIRKIVTEDHPENVEFPGYIRGEIIEGAYSGSDLFFFPSYEETEGIVVLEAIASHQNLLVRDIPVYEGWLDKDINCYMGNNNEEFAELLQQIIEKQKPDLSNIAYEVVENRSIEKVGEELKKIYTSVLDEKILSENSKTAHQC
ncbi:glycosyltransferase [Vagococcus elongatus]|uniref:Glycosyl transferase family 1 n=1 Tax=Vagococcus elongatus TaxID=180344 RepID=A0A430ARQ5_9ENTE|nr:glycosyltransferase [Vagococcus elongatus]RSU10736.1 glycosyl transferase family 1 [Vagococcus elongatus]